MKQKDIVGIVAVVIVSILVSSFVSSKFFATPKQRSQKVEVVPSISSTFPTPDPKYFNPQANDPTQLIRTGSGSSQNPFNSTSTP